MVEFEDLENMTANIASQLRKNGVTTVGKLSRKNFEDLKQILRGVSERKIRDIQEDTWKATDGWFKPGSALVEERKNQLIFPLGCEALDKLLGGGVTSGTITEFCGEFGSGKTECLLTLMVEALGKNPTYSALYYDSEETFSEIRMIEIAESRKYNAEEMLDRFWMVKVRSTDHLKATIAAADPEINEKNVKLILVDSPIAPLRVDYIGREFLQERQGILGTLLNDLKDYAKIYNLAVVVTNQVVDIPQVVYYSSDPLAAKKPTGGNIFAHTVDAIVFLRKASRNRRIARLIDSSWLPEGECVFQITGKGIEDTEGIPQEEQGETEG